MHLAPDDLHDQALVRNAHPADWANPRPAGRYNLVAIGGGTAGIISALGTAGLGGRSALVERHLLGGDCLNYGCVPSKALLRCARAAYEAGRGADFAVRAGPLAVDFPEVMQRMRRLRAELSQHDSAARFSSLGADVYLGEARFTGPRSVEVAGTTLSFQRAVIATGGRPAVPNIDGLADVGFLTNETVFSLTELPPRLVVIGGGPIGCELAQAFRRFGSEVHLVIRGERLLPKEDPEAARRVQAQFEQEGLHLHLGWQTVKVERMGDAKTLVIERKNERKKLLADAILVAVGRRPNVEGLGLEAAGVASGPRGVVVDRRLRTTNSAIFAAGDVCSRHQFTHAADAQARICVQNALFFGRRSAEALVIPRCTYTDPEVAHVGLSPAEAAELGLPIDTYAEELKEVDRAVLDGETAGYAAVHTRRGSGSIVGATLVAGHAGEMIGLMTLLMTRRLPLAALADVIHCYPTQVEVFKRIADAYRRTRLTPPVATLLRKWLAWGRR